jgi:hypothetical protein
MGIYSLGKKIEEKWPIKLNRGVSDSLALTCDGFGGLQRELEHGN